MTLPNCVYVARATGTGLVKIGAARRPQERLLGLQTGCPHALELVGLLPGGYPLERFLHKMLKHRLVRGEWYELTDAEVTELLAVEFPDGTDLPHLKEHVERFASELP